MDKAKRTSVEQWMTKADHDIQMAHAALNMALPLVDMACFHAQQCAEKSLKAFLVLHDFQVEKTHDLLKLVGFCEGLDPSFSFWGPILRDLTDFAVSGRYPDDSTEIDLEEARNVVENAGKCMAFVQGKING